MEKIKKNIINEQSLFFFLRVLKERRNLGADKKPKPDTRVFYSLRSPGGGNRRSGQRSRANASQRSVGEMCRVLRDCGVRIVKEKWGVSQ